MAETGRTGEAGDDRLPCPACGRPAEVEHNGYSGDIWRCDECGHRWMVPPREEAAVRDEGPDRRASPLFRRPERHLPRLPLLATVWAMPETPDDFREVTVEVHGRVLATEVVGPCQTEEEVWAAMGRLTDAIRRRC